MIMTNQKPVPSDPDGGLAITAELIKRLRLVWLLFMDSRVPVWVKSVLPISLLYLISPVDFLPGAVFPVVGSLDDLGVILLGMALFVKLSPQEIVQYYENLLEYGDLYSDDETVDTTYRVIDED
jgi:uncharacterized membrane protein YkvA (DUF1232 family)